MFYNIYIFATIVSRENVQKEKRRKGNKKKVQKKLEKIPRKISESGKIERR